MSECRAPIRDMLLVLNELARLDEIAQMPGSEEASADVVSAVLEEASRFAEENHGLECMFIMMNVARFAVGMGGGGLRTRDYAKGRIQGNEVGVRGGPKVPIIVHPDVRRMLMSMKSLICGRGSARQGAQAPGCSRAQAEHGFCRVDDSGGQGLEHRDWH